MELADKLMGIMVITVGALGFITYSIKIWADRRGQT
jgi:hypothetical protein